MKKIVVPEGMLRAAIDESQYATLGLSGHNVIIERTVKAALRWLSENPIVPTRRQVEEISVPYYRSSAVAKEHAMVEWQRQMFLAPEPQVVSMAGRRVLNSVMGSTFTPEDYKAIEFALRTATHGVID
jgi:hypothetical protein